MKAKTPFHGYPAAGQAADDVLQRTRRQQALVTCMDALPEAYQSALRLHYWLGTSEASMRDPELMDQLIREALAGKPPELSADFERRVLSAVRPRRLSRTGRWVLATYSVLSAMATTWLLRDVAPRCSSPRERSRCWLPLRQHRMPRVWPERQGLPAARQPLLPGARVVPSDIGLGGW